MTSGLIQEEECRGETPLLPSGGVPGYLMRGPADVRRYGRLWFNRERNAWTIEEAEPCVRELAKRVLPGCETMDRVRLRFTANRRIVGELCWLLLRYPMEISREDEGELEAQRAGAIEHARRREGLRELVPCGDPPGFVGKLYGYQREGVPFLIQNERTLLADDMGLGKTVTALAAMAQARAFPALLVVPPNVMRQWVKMAETFLSLPGGGVGELMSGPPKVAMLKGLKVYDPGPAALYVIHYGLLRGWREWLQARGFEAVIFDEAQELRHAGTDKYSAASLIGSGVRYAWALSGTPVYNYGAEIWNVLNILDYHCLGDYEAFTREWCDGYGTKTVKYPDRLGDHLRREGLMLRRRKADVLKDLPAKRRAVHVVDHDRDGFASLVKEATELARRYDAISDWKEKGQAALEIEASVRKATGITKAPYAAAFVRTLLEADERVVVFAYHHAVHDILEAALERWDPVKITGEQSPAEKAEAVNRFRDGRARVVLLSLRTAAGLDGLQERGTCVVFAELDWSPAIHSQCEDRLHRIGVKAESIMCYYLVAEHGIDEVMQEALGLKIGQIEGILQDGRDHEADRADGLQAARKHLGKVIERLGGRTEGTKGTDGERTRVS